MTQTQFTSEQMLAKLVSFDTTSVKSNLELIHWVQDYLQGHGIASTLVHDETKAKANLHAVIGPADRPGVVLSGHTDVVPVEGQAWDSDPFALHAHDGLLYGRGTCDMKGFIAVALAKLPQMTRKPLKSPVHFAFSYDEELGCLGAHSLVDHILESPVPPRLCIVGEPTSMKLITGHKGVGDYCCVVHGREFAFLARALCRQRRRGGGRTRGAHPRRRAPPGNRGSVQHPLRSAFHDDADRRDARRHGGQHRAEPLRVPLRDPQPSRRRSPCHRRGGPPACLPRHRAAHEGHRPPDGVRIHDGRFHAFVRHRQ